MLRGAAIVGLAAVLLGGCASDAAQDDDVVRRAPRPPVVVLVLDEFPTDALLTPSGEIDRERFPNFAALARTSTWFPNAFTVYDSTFKAVPSILDAVMPQEGTAADQRSHQPNAFHLMDRNGYGVVDVESGSALCPDKICPGSRIRRPGILARLAGSGRPARLHKWIGAIRRRERPMFYFQHTLLPHAPWVYLPSGRATRHSGAEPIENSNRWPGFDDPDLTDHNHLRHLLQVGFVDHELGLLVRRMTRTRVFDDALLIVLADHGHSFRVGVKSRRKVNEDNVEEIAPIPFFVKLPHQKKGRRDPALARNVDVLPTITDVLDVPIRWGHGGRSAFAEVTRQRREVSLVTRDFRRTVTVGIEEMQRRRAVVRARRAAEFGTGRASMERFGDPWASAYRIGPNQRLLGRRTDALRVSESASVSASVRSPGVVRSSPGSHPEVHPTHVAGTIAGGVPGQQRDLAVAVNGRVRAVGRSFHLRGRPPELFSLIFPERALHRGDNRVQLLEVQPDGGLVSLAEI
jgi:hypothetical protein